MSIIEGFTVKFDELCDEICALREQFVTLGDRVATLETALSNLKPQVAPNTRPAAQSAPATSRTPTK